MTTQRKLARIGRLVVGALLVILVPLFVVGGLILFFGESPTEGAVGPVPEGEIACRDDFRACRPHGVDTEAAALCSTHPGTERVLVRVAFFLVLPDAPYDGPATSTTTKLRRCE